jgi:hypothetical protein
LDLVRFELKILVLDIDRFGTEILCELDIGRPVTDNVRVRKIIFAVEIFPEHSEPRFSSRRVIVRECSVDKDVGEINPLVGKSLQHEILREIKRFFGKAVGAEAVLVCNHRQLKIRFARELCQVRDHTRKKTHFLEPIDLKIGWFTDDRAVTVDE